jgi:hypothetical protein
LQKGILNYSGSGIYWSKPKMPASALLTRMNPDIWRKLTLMCQFNEANGWG